MVALSQHAAGGEWSGWFSYEITMIPEWVCGSVRGCMNPFLIAKAADLRQQGRSPRATAAESIPCVIAITGVVGNIKDGVRPSDHVLPCLNARGQAVDVLSLPPSAPSGRQGTRGVRSPWQRCLLVFSPGTKVLG